MIEVFGKRDQRISIKFANLPFGTREPNRATGYDCRTKGFGNSNDRPFRGDCILLDR